MSLINEALKRTRDSAYQAAQTSPPVAAEYRLENGRKVRDSKTILRVLGASAAAVLTGVIVLVVWLVPRIERVKDGLVPDKSLSTPPIRAPATMAATPKPEIAPSAHAPTATPKPEVAASSQPPTATPKAEVALSSQAPAAASVPDAQRAEDQIVAKVMERIKAGQPAAPNVPPLVLQGITYSADDRDAMINGVTVHEGDVIEGARVVTIESRRVVLNLNGQEIILRLP